MAELQLSISRHQAFLRLEHLRFTEPENLVKGLTLDFLQKGTGIGQGVFFGQLNPHESFLTDDFSRPQTGNKDHFQAKTQRCTLFLRKDFSLLFDEFPGENSSFMAQMNHIKSGSEMLCDLVELIFIVLKA